MNRSFTLLVNRAAGSGDPLAVATHVERILGEAGARVETVVPSGPAEGKKAIADAVARGDVVVAVGGDGTVSALAGEVARLGGILGIIPAGRGNDFARMLGLPADPGTLATILLEAEPAATDLISTTAPDGTSRVVAGSIYAGIDAVVADRVARGHWLPRSWQYPMNGLYALATFRPTRLTVVIDGTERTFKAACVTVANSAYYGSGMRIAPEASIDDGLLDIVVIEAFGRLDMIRALPKVYGGTHVDLPTVHTFRGRSITLSAEPAILYGGDGETEGMVGSGAVLIDVVPAAVQILR
ncbi:diacylglycerol/lipid kinase family protein [Arthrobacter rhombi]|uniref:diacylglycerol/lipid kinase family protein n=1 Tax=Arthrobacter rhombi TaxID=71253 RepID=UPI003FD50D7A